VLSFTPDTEEWLRTFHATYGIEGNGMGAAWFERRALPGSGGGAEQDALTMQALEHLELAHNALLARQAQEARRKKRQEDV
jgi:hypothetical protein